MRDDDEDDIVEIDTSDTDEYPLDSVAARAISFTKLLALVDHVKNADARAEAILMLKAIRRSFKSLPTAEDVTSISGGKT